MVYRCLARVQARIWSSAWEWTIIPVLHWLQSTGVNTLKHLGALILSKTWSEKCNPVQPDFHLVKDMLQNTPPGATFSLLLLATIGVSFPWRLVGSHRAWYSPIQAHMNLCTWSPTKQIYHNTDPTDESVHNVWMNYDWLVAEKKKGNYRVSPTNSHPTGNVIILQVEWECIRLGTGTKSRVTSANSPAT